MTDSELHEAIRGLYRIQQLGMLDELRRWIAAAMNEHPVPADHRDDPRWLLVSLFARDVAGILGVDVDRVERAAMAIYLPSRETIVLDEIRRMLARLDGRTEDGESVDSMMLALAAETGFMTAADFEGQRESAKQSAYKPAPSCERLRIIREGA